MTIVKFKYPDTEKIGLARSFKEIPQRGKVVVKTERGFELVECLKSYEVKELEKFGISEKDLYQVVREGTQEDENAFLTNLFFAQEALQVCKEKVKHHGLEMKLVKAYTTLNRERIVFYFTAKNRVDFRKLVRDLASHFKRRIELRQIGVRDEVKMIGAVGMCGKVCCCKEFLSCFHSVSLNLARLQGLPPNPAKLSGTCGRLMCCLKFEEANYYIRQFLPEVGEEVETPLGKGKVADVNVLLEKVVIEFEEGKKEEFHVSNFVEEEVWREYIEKLKEKKDDRFSCYTKAGVIGDESNQRDEELPQ